MQGYIGIGHSSLRDALRPTKIRRYTWRRSLRDRAKMVISTMNQQASDTLGPAKGGIPLPVGKGGGGDALPREATFCNEHTCTPSPVYATHHAGRRRGSFG